MTGAPAPAGAEGPLVVAPEGASAPAEHALAGAAAVLFDFDGTLFHLAWDLDGWRRWSRGLLPAGDRRHHRVDDILDAAPDAAVRARMLQALADAEHAALAAGAAAAGARRTVDAIRRHVPVAVVSRNFRSTVTAALGRLGLGDVPVVGREDTDRPKPDPAPVRLALERLRAPAERSVMVGDTWHDVAVARACAMRVAVVRNPSLAWAPTGADVVLASLSELPGHLGLRVRQGTRAGTSQRWV